MNQRTIASDALLVLAAVIWGSAFVAQRLGMEYMEPWAFNACRFIIGAFSLAPLLLYQRSSAPLFTRTTLWGGMLLGFVLMIGAGLQQAGLVYTTAGKAAFITGLYLVMVPLFGLFVGQSTSRDSWAGICLALPGLALLTLGDNFVLNKGDTLEMVGAIFWALHLILVGWLAPRHNGIALAFVQFMTCSFLSFMVSGFFESFELAQVKQAWASLAFAGVMSVGVAYTLQVIAQKTTPVAHASIILSLETVFAVIAGYLFLNETLSGRAIIGCALMLFGMVVSQLGLRGIRQMLRGQTAGL